MKNTKIPIVFSADNYYVPYTATMIQSIMENADQNKQYIFFILHQEINNDNMNLLKKQIALFRQFSIEFINVSPYIDKYNLFVSRHITVAAYYRLLIPELLSEYQKAIYLDGDMICCTDISELFDINIENYLLASVRDTAVSLYYSKKEEKYLKNNYRVLLSLKNPDEYFNSGMCIFNIELFRKTISTEKILELAASREWIFHDQDVLNYVAEGKTLLLPYHWNYFYNSEANYLPDILRNEYFKAEKNPKIIHFLWKPWNTFSNIEYFELFWKYATRTPFINIIIKRMKDKEIISNKSFGERIISNIKHREGLGLKFILINCLKAWLSRDKLKKNSKK